MDHHERASAMTAPVEIDRSKHTPEALESMSRECKDERFARRLRGIAMILRGASRGDVARAQDPGGRGHTDGSRLGDPFQ